LPPFAVVDITFIVICSLELICYMALEKENSV
jgi:hypothetical protein